MRLQKRTNKLRNPWLPLLGMAALIFLGIFWGSTAQGGGDPNLPENSGTLLDQQILLNNVATTEAAEQREQQDQQAARGRSDLPAKDGSNPPEQGYLSPAQVYGIINNPVPLAGWGGVYAMENGWVGPVSGTDIHVNAGAKADVIGSGIFNTPEQGVLAVDGNGQSLYGEYLTASRTGSIRVTSYSGTCLTLTSTGNTTYQFDVATRQWSCVVNNRPPPP